MWLGDAPYAGSWPFCLTFVRGAAGEQVLAAFGAGPVPDAGIMPRSAPAAAQSGLPLLLLRPAGDWLAALEQHIPPRGVRPDVLRRVSVAAEAVSIYQDIGKQNHEFAHAANGEVVSAVTTSVPARWWGSDPDRLRPLAHELGMPNGPSADTDLTPLQALLALAEGVFGLSLDQADLDRPWRAARLQPGPADRAPGAPPGEWPGEGPGEGPGEPPPAAAGTGAGTAAGTGAGAAAGTGAGTGGVGTGLVDAGPVAAHVQRLLAAGLSPADIGARAGMTPVGLDRLLRGVMPQVPAATAQRLLAIEVL